MRLACRRFFLLEVKLAAVADTLEELNEMVRDAVICHVEEEFRPKIIRLNFVRGSPLRYQAHPFFRRAE